MSQDDLGEEMIRKNIFKNRKFIITIVLVSIVFLAIGLLNSSLTFNIAQKLESWGANKEAAKFYDLTLYLDKKVPNIPLKQQSHHLRSIINFYINKLEYSKAERYLNEQFLLEKRSLETFKSLYEWDLLIFNDIYSELSTIYYLQGDYNKSKKYASKNLCTYKQRPDNCYPFIKKESFEKWKNIPQKHFIDYESLERLGYIAIQQKKYEQAKKLFDEYSDYDKHLREIKYYYDLAYLYIKQKNYKLAEEYLNQILKNKEFIKTSLHGNFYNDFLGDLNESLSPHDIEIFRKTNFLNLKALML